MKEFTSPTYFLDLEDSHNRAVLESAKPGKEIRVRVKQEEVRSAPSIAATGTLSDDSKIFHVVVVTSAGRQTHDRGWSELQQDLAGYRQ
jgi:hypothetical protein